MWRIALLACSLALASCGNDDLTTEERNLAISMRLSQVPVFKGDPSNAVSQDPRAIALGKALFFDTALSASGATSCASCHMPDRQFQDGLPLAVAAGTNTRRTMPLAGLAIDKWFFWDGRKDSLWSQALGPLENPVEHATDRQSVVRHVKAQYAEEYHALFPQATEVVADIDKTFANVGKAIAAYVATINHMETRFDRVMDAWAKGSSEIDLSKDEKRGLKFFLGEGNCVTCHTGPRFTDGFFHNTGVPEVAGLPPDNGRMAILKEVKADPFNCLGPYSDAKPGDCRELRFMSTNNHELERAFKTPSLRGVANRSPYMHAGQFATLDAVLQHYGSSPAAPRGHSELRDISLSSEDKTALIAFLKTLSDLE
jgi:cytochrome c peroxidase